MSNFDKVIKFHKKYGVPTGKIYDETWPIVPDERAFFRVRLITEELAELIEAMYLQDYVNIAKELADVLYAVYGTAAEYGIPMNKVFSEVHKANMTKNGGKDDDGKVKKGPGYKPANIGKVLK